MSHKHINKTQTKELTLKLILKQLQKITELMEVNKKDYELFRKNYSIRVTEVNQQIEDMQTSIDEKADLQ